MNRNCSCGGKICSLDWKWNEKSKFYIHSDIASNEPTVAHFQCNRCMRRYNQRKRLKHSAQVLSVNTKLKQAEQALLEASDILEQFGYIEHAKRYRKLAGNIV